MSPHKILLYFTSQRTPDKAFDEQIRGVDMINKQFYYFCTLYDKEYLIVRKLSP
jgi:hypothetical protein